MDEHQQEIKSPYAQDMLRAAGLPPDVCHGEGEVLMGALRTSRQLGGVVEVATWCWQQQSCAGPAAPRSRICSFPGHFTSASLTVSSSNGNDFYLGWNLMMKKKPHQKARKILKPSLSEMFHFFIFFSPQGHHKSTLIFTFETSVFRNYASTQLCHLVYYVQIICCLTCEDKITLFHHS